MARGEPAAGRYRRARQLLGEGDWIAIDYDLAETAARTGLSQYELLTGLGRRFGCIWS